MYKPVKFITEIPYKDFSTFYLFCKSSKTLLPIEIENKQNTNSQKPSIYNSMKRILVGSGIFISHIKIYYHCANTFYVYLAIKKEGGIFEVNISFKDALEIYKEMPVPIYVRENILKNYGIEITKDIVLKALRE